MQFDNGYSPSLLRFAIEIEMQSQSDPQAASMIAMAKLKEDPKYYNTRYGFVEPMRKAKLTFKKVYDTELQKYRYKRVETPVQPRPLHKAEPLPTRKNKELLFPAEIEDIWTQINKLDMSGNTEKKLGKINDTDIWLMDFNKLKVEMDADTIEGTNSSVLKEKHESAGKFDFASVDFDIAEHERPFIILHEIIEKTLMDKHGLKYNPAHNVANAIEMEYREKYLKTNESKRELYRI